MKECCTPNEAGLLILRLNYGAFYRLYDSYRFLQIHTRQEVCFGYAQLW